MTKGEEEKKNLIEPSNIVFAVLALLTGAFCYAQGQGVFFQGLADAVDTMWQVLPKMIGAILMAGFFQVLVPGKLVVKWVGEKSGFKGIMIAYLAGLFTPAVL